MRGILFIGCLFYLQVASGAQVADVRCAPAGCLVKGWTFHDYVQQTTTYFECKDNDCVLNGWFSYAAGGQGEFEAICEGRGCFLDGYEVYDRVTRESVARVQCFTGDTDERDCLKSGWSSWGRSESWVARCVNNDCRKDGWRVSTPQGWQRVICKRGDCFQNGWTVHLN